MIYFDSGALLKFVKREKESDALRSWRGALPAGTEMLTSELAGLEIGRTLLRAGVDHQRVPYVTGQALRGLSWWTSPAPSSPAPGRTGFASWVPSTPSTSPRPTCS